MNQNQLAELFATSIPNISTHISNILKEKELDTEAVIKYYLTTASDGKKYEVAFYSLGMILAIGFRVRSKRGTQFRIWANNNLKEYMIKGFVMDDERLETQMDALTILTSYWNAFAIYALPKNDSIKKYAIYLPSVVTTMLPIKPPKCFLQKPKTNCFML